MIDAAISSFLKGREMETDMKQLELEVITSMRAAIANFDTDHSVVREQMSKAHNLFADHSERWSEAFCTLYSEMLEIYCAYTPQPRGRYRLKHIGIGYSSFPVKTWVADKVQPPKPTADELVMRFDRLIGESRVNLLGSSC